MASERSLGLGLDGEGAAVAGQAVAGSGARSVLEASSLVKHFRVRRRGRGDLGPRQVVHAVDDVSLVLYAGEVTALVGESGSGKSTLARVLAQLVPATGGTIRLNGNETRYQRGRRYRGYARQVQLVFQDPFSSLNPVHKVGYQLSRPLRTFGRTGSKAETQAVVERLLGEVNLSPPSQYSEKFPHELSGGQLQRVAIARALAAEPAVMLADEPVSMLDVSIRLGVLNLMERLVRERELALLYVTHDMASARYFATTTLVMYAGQLVEGAPSESVTQDAAHPYTQLLLSSAPDPERRRRARGAAKGEPPSLITPPSGCRFHPRCPHAMAVCAEQLPPRSDLGEGRWVRCWLHVTSGQASPAPGNAPAPSEQATTRSRKERFA